MSLLLTLQAPPSSALVFAKVETSTTLLFSASDSDGVSFLKSDESLSRALSGRLSSVLKRGRIGSDPSCYFSLVKVTSSNSGDGRRKRGGDNGGGETDEVGAAASVLKSLSTVKLEIPAIDSSTGKEQGLRSWLSAYNEKGGAQSKDSRELQRQVDDEVFKFDTAEGEKDLAKKELAARMQADGFTLITRKTRIEDGNDEHESSTFKKKRKRGDISAGVDFYNGSSSNLRREKAQKIAALRDEFEKDKERIIEMKGKRGNGRVFRG